MNIERLPDGNKGEKRWHFSFRASLFVFLALAVWGVWNLLSR